MYIVGAHQSAQGEHGWIDTKGSQIRNFSMYSGGAWTDWYTLAYTKGEHIWRFQQVLKGSMYIKRYTKEENILVRPLPLMSKGESDLVWWLRSSPKGEIVGIMIQVLSLMETHSETGTGDGNLIRGQILVQQDKKEIYAGSVRKISVYMQVGFSKSAYMWKMLGPYNTSDYPITIVVIPLIYIVVPLLPPCCYFCAP